MLERSWIYIVEHPNTSIAMRKDRVCGGCVFDNHWEDKIVELAPKEKNLCEICGMRKSNSH